MLMDITLTSTEFILFLFIAYVLYGMSLAIDKINTIKGIEKGYLVPSVFRAEHYFVAFVLPTLPLYRKALLYSFVFVLVSFCWLYLLIKGRGNF